MGIKNRILANSNKISKVIYIQYYDNIIIDIQRYFIEIIRAVFIKNYYSYRFYKSAFR